MLQMQVGLAGDVVHDVPDVLSPAAADEVLLRSSVLQKHKEVLSWKKRFQEHRHRPEPAEHSKMNGDITTPQLRARSDPTTCSRHL